MRSSVRSSYSESPFGRMHDRMTEREKRGTVSYKNGKRVSLMVVPYKTILAFSK